LSLSEKFTSDPTVQFPIPGAISLRYSLAEIEAQSRKAARGAGYFWGFAEEAGKATRWLCSHGLKGADALAGLLRHNDGVVYADVQPALTEGVWIAPKEQLCPIAVGTAISDRMERLVAGKKIICANVLHPVLVAYFAAVIAARTDSAIKLEWSSVSAVCVADHICITDPLDEINVTCAEKLVVGVTEPQESSKMGVHLFDPSAKLVDVAVWKALGDFAFRTYAPATDQSRSGAGAGIIDRD